MTRDDIIQAIYHILKNKIELPTIASFHEDARLNEDLYMDSVMILELILFIELDLGIKMPDEALSPNDFRTVGHLATFLERQHEKEVVEITHD
ncbi:petrobactin biosynthesis protein AsbD [Metabacillus sp. B2-18]|uniref:petrobactin biosynthesis protein AsbD n=1 Tax=Metabacillus sp. B2-18 TaxID=2897333 RepID=UPI001E2F6D51|nr:petrobactin biosynthesis protein AsbD [Metabacillus sp. B2-18]UGB30374.1 petrobactin biosynthesis protein AsbD [Metabacillus sp. B2-18]